MAFAQKINTHTDHRGNEIRNVSLEKLAALPTAPFGAGQVVQVGADIFYGNTASSWMKLVKLSDLTARPRHVGAIDASSGTIPLVVAADTDGTTNWNTGDFGMISVSGTLSPAPLSGNAVVQAGDMVFMTGATATGNASFIVVESNLAQPMSLLGGFTDIAATDWTGAAGAWTVTKTTAASSNVPYGVTFINATTNQAESFDTELTAGSIKVNCTNALAPTVAYKIRAGV